MVAPIRLRGIFFPLIQEFKFPVHFQIVNNKPALVSSLSRVEFTPISLPRYTYTPKLTIYLFSLRV